MAFGKLKRLIKNKVPTSPRNKKVDTTKPDSTPAPASVATALEPVVVDDVASTDMTTPIKTTAAPKALTKPSALKENQTGADDVLDGILQDLNIKVGQLAVDAEQSDSVSEYSGGSAKSLESSSSDETGDGDDDDEETDDDEMELPEEDEPKGKNKKKRNTVGERVAAVVAAAEEIRKKRNSPILTKTSKESDKAKVAAKSDPSSRSPSPAITEQVESLAPKEDQVPASSTEGDPSKSSKNSKDNKPKGGQSKPIISLPSMKALRSSPITTFLAKNNRSTSPQFSPEIKPKGAPVHNENIISKSFDTRDDDHTSGTRDVTEEGEEVSCDGEDNTLSDNTIGTDGMSIEEDAFQHARSGISMSDSQNDSTVDSVIEEEDRRKTTKKPVMNKDIIIHKPGGPSSLVVRAMYYTPLPANPDDIIIKVEASTVSFRDCLLRRDIGMDKVKFPFVPGCEVVGTISNIGRAARQEGYRVGDRVVGLTRSGGGNGYYAKLTTKNIAPVQSTALDAADVVCLVDVYMTAYQALQVGKKDGIPLTDSNVLITDGFSPVGQAAVQLAKLEGAKVYVTTTERRQDEYMKTLGVKCLPLAPSKWLHKLKGKMDIVIDNTCFDTYDSSWKALNENGVLVCTGMTSIYGFEDYKGADGCGCDAFGDMRDLQAKWASVKARYMMSQTKVHDLSESFKKDPKKYHQELKYLCFLVESGALKPKIAERVSIEEIPDAQRYLETGKANGTIVCFPG